MDKTQQLGTAPIGKLLAQYSIPAVIAMIVNAVYNVVDRIFIGQYVGEAALGGLTVGFPMMMLVVAFASLIAAGGASLMSIKLGENDAKSASHIFGNSLSLGVIITLLMVALFLPNMDRLLTVLGATETLLPYAASYMNIILMGFIFQMISFILSSSVRIEGYPILAMVSMLVSAITNIILDYVFIGVLGWGVKGAALATTVGQIVGFVILVSFYLRGKGILKISMEDFKLKFKTVRDIFSIGFTSFISSIGTCVAMVFLNRSLTQYGGNAAITAMGAITSLSTMFIMPMIGIQQGMQPIIGYNHGANLKKRVNKTLGISIIASSVFATIVFIALQLSPDTFIGLFLDKTSSTMPMAVEGLRYSVMLLPILSISFIGTAYFQSIAKGKEAILLGSLRQFVLLIPLVIVLPSIFGLTGVWMATPVADGITIILTAILLLMELKGSSKKESVNDNNTLAA